MAIPTLVQRVAFGALFSGQGLSATNFTIRLPNKVGNGNCVVLIMDFDQALTVSSITDDAGNTWSSTPAVSADAGAGNMKTQAYVMAGANSSGARAITITYSAAASTAHFLLTEWCNVATSSAVGVTANSITAAAPSIRTAAISPSAGNLVLHYAMDNANVIGQAGTASVSAWVADAGWWLEAADYASGHAGGPVDMNAYGFQTRIAPGGSITPKLTTTGTNSFSSIALELVAAAAGTPPPSSGIYVLRQQYFLNTNIDQAVWKEPFPCSGNLLCIFDIQGIVQSAPADSHGNTWALPVSGLQNSVAALAYAKNVNPGQTLELQIAIGGSPSRNTTIVVYDITGADTASPFVQSVTAPATSETGNFTGQPIITPTNKNGLTLVATAIGIGPLTSVTQPAGAYFCCVTYPGETDFDTFDNADGYGVFYYGTNLAQQNWGWGFAGTAQSAYSTGVEFKVGSGSGVDPTPTANNWETRGNYDTQLVPLSWFDEYLDRLGKFDEELAGPVVKTHMPRGFYDPELRSVAWFDPEEIPTKGWFDVELIDVQASGTNYNRSIGESISAVVDAVARLFTGNRAPAESVTSSDSVGRAFAGARSLPESLSSPSDAVTRSFGATRAPAESVSAPSDAVARAFAGSRSPAESLSTSDAVSRAFAGSRGPAESLSAPSDSVTRNLGAARSLAESLSAASDSVARTFAGARAPAESLSAPSDSVARSFVGFRSIADSTSAPSDSVSGIKNAGGGTNYPRSPAESISAPSDAVTRAFAGSRVPSESVSAPADAVARGFTGARSIAESVPAASDAVARSRGVSRTIGESVSAPADTVSRSISLMRSVGESISAALDAVLRAVGFKRTVSESVPTPLDAVVGAKNANQAFVGGPAMFGRQDQVALAGRSDKPEIAGQQTAGSVKGSVG
jgi:hypothetical protein